MNIGHIFQLLFTILQAAASMEGMQTGTDIHTKDVGLPPIFVTWRDGRSFEVDLRIKRIK